MAHQHNPSDDLKRAACQIAWQALAQNDPQKAAEALTPFAEKTNDDLEVAEVWSAMLAWLEDTDHLEREIRRLATKWAKEHQIVTLLAQA